MTTRQFSTNSEPQHEQRPPWIRRHAVLGVILAGTLGLAVGAGIGAASHTAQNTIRTVTQYQAVPGPTVTVAGPTVTVTATPTANAQGQATQINQDGVYVVGQDIPGGTWHTSGGSQCYEATLNSTNTSDIIDNNNFTGPDTVGLSGAKAFEISGGCTWQHMR